MEMPARCCPSRRKPGVLYLLLCLVAGGMLVSCQAEGVRGEQPAVDATTVASTSSARPLVPTYTPTPVSQALGVDWEVDRSPLHVAAVAGRTEVVRQLLLAGTGLDAWDDNFGTFHFLTIFRTDHPAYATA